MMYVEAHLNAKRHARTGSEQTESDGQQYYQTWCGRWIRGGRGESIVALIDCKGCRKSLRVEGWNV